MITSLSVFMQLFFLSHTKVKKPSANAAFFSELVDALSF